MHRRGTNARCYSVRVSSRPAQRCPTNDGCYYWKNVRARIGMDATRRRSHDLVMPSPVYLHSARSPPLQWSNKFNNGIFHATGLSFATWKRLSNREIPEKSGTRCRFRFRLPENGKIEARQARRVRCTHRIVAWNISTDDSRLFTSLRIYHTAPGLISVSLNRALHRFHRASSPRPVERSIERTQRSEKFESLLAHVTIT